MERNLPAALTQCFSAVALCTAVADPNWITVYNGTAPSELDEEIFGVAYVVHLNGNLTVSPDPDHLLTHNGIVLLYGMAVCCYVAILTGLMAFLIDFLGTQTFVVLTAKVTALLHSLTAILSAATVALSCWLFILIFHKLKDPKLLGMQAVFGESFYLAIAAVCLSSFAAGLRFCISTQRRVEFHPVQHKRLVEEASPLLEDEEDRDRIVYR